MGRNNGGCCMGGTTSRRTLGVTMDMKEKDDCITLGMTKKIVDVKII